MPPGQEIERKYLLSSVPSDAELAALGARPHRIEQVYLRSDDGWVRRVRMVQAAGRTRYVATRKREIDGIVREELEEELDAAAYDRLLADADPDRRAIRKVRHVFPFAGHVLELDVFEDPPGLALLEVELEDASEVPALPPAVQARVVREVSLESAYMNHELARRPAAGDRPRGPPPVTHARVRGPPRGISAEPIRSGATSVDTRRTSGLAAFRSVPGPTRIG